VGVDLNIRPTVFVGNDSIDILQRNSRFVIIVDCCHLALRLNLISQLRACILDAEFRFIMCLAWGLVVFVLVVFPLLVLPAQVFTKE
jgi:hypothetical protein